MARMTQAIQAWLLRNQFEGLSILRLCKNILRHGFYLIYVSLKDKS